MSSQDNQKAARELLPCPFCGGEAAFLPYKRDGLTLCCLSFGCVRRDQRCGIRLSTDQLRERMAENWNRRTVARELLFTLRDEAQSLLDYASKHLDHMTDTQQTAAYDWWIGRRDTLVELLEKLDRPTPPDSGE